MKKRTSHKLRYTVLYILVGNRRNDKYQLGTTCVGAFTTKALAELWLESNYTILGFSSIKEAVNNTRIEATNVFS